MKEKVRNCFIAKSKSIKSIKILKSFNVVNHYYSCHFLLKT